jgi:hypothetical protein
VASFRKPKGVYNRNTPDWNSSQICIASGVQIPSGAGNSNIEWSLYNDATDGRSLYLYGLGLADNENYIFGLLDARGLVGTFSTQGRVNTSAGANAPGALYYQNKTTSMSVYDSIYVLQTNGFFMMFPAPLWIIAPGYRLTLGAAIQAQLFFGVNFYYVPLASD